MKAQLREHCLSPLGKELVEGIAMSVDADQINEWLEQVREFRRIQESNEEFPLDNFFDIRESVTRIRLEGTHMEENELHDLNSEKSRTQPLPSLATSAANWPIPREASRER